MEKNTFNKFDSQQHELNKLKDSKSYKNYISECNIQESDFFPPADNRRLKSSLLDADTDNGYYDYLNDFNRYCIDRGVYEDLF